MKDDDKDKAKKADEIEEEIEAVEELEEEAAAEVEDAAELFDDEADDSDPDAVNDPKPKRQKKGKGTVAKKPAAKRGAAKSASKPAAKAAPAKAKKSEDDGIDIIVKGLTAIGGEATIPELWKHLRSEEKTESWTNARWMRTVMHNYVGSKLTRTSNTTWAVKGKEGSRKPVEKKAPAKAKKAAEKTVPKAAPKKASAKKAPAKKVSVTKGTKQGDKSRKKR